jgi:MarR family transcriptional regulator, organic hydroperoxide resistance regulator
MVSLPLDGAVWRNVDSALRSVDRLYNTPFEELNLNVMQAYILRALYEQDGQRPSDLAHIVGRPPTSFTPILDKLEDKGFIHRSPHPSDRRSIRIYLTASGSELREPILSGFQEADQTIQKQVKADDLSHFLSILHALQSIGNDSNGVN